MISIIGAGPAGAYLAELLARKGEDVNIYEEHKDIGNPVQCTGILTETLSKLIDVNNDIIANIVKKVRIISSDKEFTEVKLKPNYILDRRKLDQYLVNRAVENGAKLHLGKRFLDYKENSKIEMSFNDGKIETDYLIGADGVASRVAKHFNRERKYVQALQVRANLEIEDKELVEVYVGSNYGDFAWVVPEDNKIARIGLAGTKNTQELFKKLLEYKKAKIIDYQSGLVPLYDYKLRLRKGNVFLIGDAATMVKATSHGGILQGMMAAKVLADNFDSYEEKFNKDIGRDLGIALLMRKVMNKFNDDDFRLLVKLFKKDRLRKILNEHDRDFPSQFGLKLLLNEPRLLRYVFKAIF